MVSMELVMRVQPQSLRIELNWNGYGLVVEGSKPLLENKAFQQLFVGHTDFADDEAAVLAAAVTVNQLLKVLRLRGSRIGDKCVFPRQKASLSRTR
jgi:hypothetical protein